MKTVDLAIIESKFNGGDLQLKVSDLAVVFNIENMVYLGLFGGNLEQSTENNVVLEQSFDWWGNNLFYENNKGAQFNSKTERIINTTPLTSNGRVIIENAIKDDLLFFKDLNATVNVSVTIVNIDHLYVEIKVEIPTNEEKIIIINFRKQSDGDFFAPDFNDDFFI
jgi:hypothetical protein